MKLRKITPLLFLTLIKPIKITNLKHLLQKTYFQWCFYTLCRLHWSILQEVTDCHFVISLLFYLLVLHTIPFGSWKTKRNFKQEQPIRTFLNRLYIPRQVYLTAPIKELLIILLFLGTMPSNLKRTLQTSIQN